jgi:multiple sugar transport system permease protein
LLGGDTFPEVSNALTTNVVGPWPFLVLTNSPDRQPLSVRLPAIQAQTQIGVLLASMLIASLVPLLGFLIFQRTFLRGTGLGGALKG